MTTKLRAIAENYRIILPCSSHTRVLQSHTNRSMYQPRVPLTLKGAGEVPAQATMAIP